MTFITSFIAGVTLAISSIFGAPILGAQPALTTFQGGTGTTTPVGILYGDATIGLKSVTVGTNLTFSGGTLSATGGSGSSAFEVATTSDIAVSQIAYINKTTGRTTLASVPTTTVTATSPLSLSQPVVKVGGANSVLSIATTTNSLFTGTPGQVLGYTNLGWVGVATTTAGTGLTYTGTAFNVNTSQNIATLSNLTGNGLVYTSGGVGTLNTANFSANTIPYVNGAGTAILYTATSSLNLGVSGGGTGATTLTGVLLGNGTSAFTAASTQTCTNQFVRAMSSSYVATCATVGAADVSLANLTATDSTLTFSGTYNGSTARTIGLNLGNANTWIATQTFNVGGGANGILTNSLVGIGTTTPEWALTIASTTGPQLALSDGSQSNSPWTFRSINGNLYIATSSAATFATSTNSALTILNSGDPSLGIATSSFVGILGLGPQTANGSTTVSMGKLQFDGYDAGGARRCVFWNAAGTLTTVSGACTP